MTFLMSVPHCLDYHCFILILKLGSMRFPSFFFFIIVFGYSRPFAMSHVRISLSISKKSAGILIEIALNL